jgi:hypothetical protein
MKKAIAVLFLTVLSLSAFAGPHGYHGSALRVQHHGHVVHSSHWRHHSGGWNWMVPAIIGGAVVYEISKNQQSQPQPPIIVQQQTVPPQQNCTPWTETQHADGSITRTRTCTQ